MLQIHPSPRTLHRWPPSLYTLAASLANRRMVAAKASPPDLGRVGRLPRLVQVEEIPASVEVPAGGDPIPCSRQCGRAEARGGGPCRAFQLPCAQVYKVPTFAISGMGRDQS
jgi:hypothetical protein